MNRSMKRWMLSLVCLIVFATIVVLAKDNVGNASSKTQWEYKVLSTGSQPAIGMSDAGRGLNQLGEDGWEFVQFIRTSEVSQEGGIWILKRPK